MLYHNAFRFDIMLKLNFHRSCHIRDLKNDKLNTCKKFQLLTSARVGNLI